MIIISRMLMQDSLLGVSAVVILAMVVGSQSLASQELGAQEGRRSSEVSVRFRLGGGMRSVLRLRGRERVFFGQLRVTAPPMAMRRCLSFENLDPDANSDTTATYIEQCSFILSLTFTPCFYFTVYDLYMLAGLVRRTRDECDYLFSLRRLPTTMQ